MRDLDEAGEAKQSGEQKSPNVDVLDLLKDGSASQQIGNGFFRVNNHWNTDLNSPFLEFDDMFKDIMNQPSKETPDSPPSNEPDEERLKLEK